MSYHDIHRLLSHGTFEQLWLIDQVHNSSAVNTIAGGAVSFRDPSHLFAFPSVPQEGLNGRSFSVVGGVMLGGSSGVNGMQVRRGQKEDYDRWGGYFGDN